MFIDDYAMHPELRNDWSFLFRFSVEGGSFVRLELAPVKLCYARVGLATGEERGKDPGAGWRGLSAEMGTSFARREGSLVIERA